MTDPLSPSQIAELRERRFELSLLERELLATVEAQAAVIERYRDGWQSYQNANGGPPYFLRAADDGSIHHRPMSPAEQVVVYGEVVESEERNGA